MGLSDAGDRLIGQRDAVMTERAVRLDGDAVSRGGFAGDMIGEMRVQFELIDRRRDACLVDNAVQVCGLEVGDTRTAQPSVGDNSVNAFHVET